MQFISFSAGLVILLFAFDADAHGLGVNAGDGTITKVVKLLQGMLDKSKKDGEENRDLYAKFKCYCDDNKDSKTMSIEELTTQIGLLESKIDELQGSNGELSNESAQLRADMTENEAARAEAEALRTTARTDFVAEEADMSQAIEQMGKAIDVLAEVGADQSASVGADHTKFMAGQASLLKLKATVNDALTAASGFLTRKQKSSVESFLQKAPFTGAYTAQSGEVVGILKTMRDTFTSNLASARAAEKAQAEAFAKFMKTKTEAYATMKTSYDDKQIKLGANDGELATKRTQLDEAVQQKADDEEFLSKLVVMCAQKAKEYEERQMLRTNEESAIAQCIAILNSDAAFESFGKVTATKTGATGFIQLSSAGRGGLRVRSVRDLAQQVLAKAGAVNKSLKLAKVAGMLEKGNPFTVVLTEIEKMIHLIGEEGKADSEHLSWCNSERESNHGDLDAKTSQIITLKTEIDDLHSAINDPVTGLKLTITDTEAKLATNHDNQVSETKARTEENLAYQQNIANIVDAEHLLSKAVKALKRFYTELEKKEEAALSLSQREEPAPPSTWEGDFKGQSSKGGDAIDMLEFIVSETQKEETTAHQDEEDAQKAFEDSMTALKVEEADLGRSLDTLRKELADKEMELISKRTELGETEADKVALEQYLEKIKPGCDFITTNFDLRESNRVSEKAALENATKLLKESPAFQAAVTVAQQTAMGECKEKCVGREQHVECKACLAGVSIPGYCAGHNGTEGC